MGFKGDPVRLLVIPGLNDSGPAHWQTWLQAHFSRRAVRVEQEDWARADLARWSQRVEMTLARHPRSRWVAVAHSFGCLALLRHLALGGEGVHSALLVAPADPAKFGVAAKLPQSALAIPSVLLASETDPWMRFESARAWAGVWGSQVINLGDVGHINTEAGFGPLPPAKNLVERMIQRLERERHTTQTNPRAFSFAEPQEIADVSVEPRLIPKTIRIADAIETANHDGGPMKIFWFIPTHGDSRYLGSTKGARAATFDYFKQIAIAADSLGYEGVLLPTGRSCEDSWIVAASLIDATTRLKFLVALRPGLVQPVQSARMAATLDRLSGGRLLVNLVTGGDADELAGDGLFLEHGKRYELSREFLTIYRETLRRSFDGSSFDFEGEHLKVQGAKLLYPPLQNPYPPMFFGGSSDAAHELCAEQLDTYLTWGEPPAAVAEKLADVRRRAARHGRSLSCGIRLHVIVRETEDEAWRAAAELVSQLDEATVSAAQKKLTGMDSVGQRRMAELNKGRFDKADIRAGLEVAPNLWAGVGLVRGGAGTALVGNPEQVAARIKEYAALGLDYFILSGYPHLEEAHRFAELVFPLLPLDVRAKLPGRTLTGPFGEIVANSYAPKATEAARA